MSNTEEKHCSICVYYELCANFQMYCHALKRRITARKQAKNCKYYKYKWEWVNERYGNCDCPYVMKKLSCDKAKKEKERSEK